MATLAIDTVSDEIALAFDDGEGNERVLVRESERDHSRLLLPMVEEVSGGNVQGIAEICVVRGPGNYTGLRVGIATARGLAIATGARLSGIDTHAAIAAAANLDGAWLAIHPAGRGEFSVRRCEGNTCTGGLGTATAEELKGERLAGEGATQLSGVEVGAGDRVLAALRLARTAPNLDDAIYLRAPNITRPRETPTRPT